MLADIDKRPLPIKVDLARVPPDVYPFSAYLGYQYGCTHLIDLGCGNLEGLTQLSALFNVMGVRVGREAGSSRDRPANITWLDWDLRQEAVAGIAPAILERSIIVSDGLIERLADTAPLLKLLSSWLDYAPLAVIATPDSRSGVWAMPRSGGEVGGSSLSRLLSRQGLNVALSGFTGGGDSGLPRKAMAVVEKNSSNNGTAGRAVAEAVPSDFRVVAIMTSYNEEDIIVPSIRRLANQGIGVYLIDNWSTDATWDLAGTLLGKELLGREKYPTTSPSGHFDLTSLLTRVERVAGTLDADWFIHHDVDEIRASPWPSLNLLEGLYKVDRAGFNAVNHTIIEFHPVNNDYVPGTDFESSFKYFEFSKHPAHMLKISTWKNLGQPVSLAASGGHQVVFEGRRTFPYKFLLKHYPVRSQAHGEKKIFRERKSRWNSTERAMGWHYQYDHIVENHNFLRDASELRLFDEASFGANYLVQRLTGIGLLISSD